MNLEEHLKNLNEIEAPTGLHKRIMELVFFEKIKLQLLVMLSILFSSFYYTFVEGGKALLDAETQDVLNDLYAIGGNSLEFMANSSLIVLNDLPYSVVFSSLLVSLTRLF